MITSDFVLNKGLTNEFIITIKQQGSTDPMLIDVSDTFTTKLYFLGTNKEAAANIVTTVESAIGGKLKIVFNDVDGLVSERGEKVDRYYLKPTYRLAIDCKTLNNGNFIAKLPNVYVE